MKNIELCQIYPLKHVMSGANGGRDNRRRTYYDFCGSHKLDSYDGTVAVQHDTVLGESLQG